MTIKEAKGIGVVWNYDVRRTSSRHGDFRVMRKDTEFAEEYFRWSVVAAVECVWQLAAGDLVNLYRDELPSALRGPLWSVARGSVSFEDAKDVMEVAREWVASRLEGGAK